MPIREFIDSSGVSWRVWNTVPSARASLSGEFGTGWLTFESAAGRRRLAPIPDHWESATTEALERMCQAATEARRSGAVEPTDDVEGETRL